MDLPSDWQTSKQKIAERGQYLLQTGQWSDCKFIVGQEPNEQTLKAHKLFLAMSSPVFQAMFFGGIPEKNDPIPIKDVQPKAFKALLEYIYTDQVNLSSFELACELCYCAKKYMLPSLVEECTRFLWFELSPKKACRAYEFAKLFEEPGLMKKCLQIICVKTKKVLEAPSWEEVELGTLLTVLDQEELNITSELDLFHAVERWAKAECARKSLDPNDGKALRSVIGNALSKIKFLCLSPQQFAEGPGMSPLLTQDEAFAILMNIICTENKVSMPEGFSTESPSRNKPLNIPLANRVTFCIRKEVTRQGSPQAINPYVHTQNCRPLQSMRHSGFLNDGESSSTSQSPPRIFERKVRQDNGSSTVSNACLPLIEGGIQKEPKYYCLRSVLRETDCLNTDVLDCFLTFSVDKNICVLGVQVPTQIAGLVDNRNHALDYGTSYTEILYAHLLDSDNTRLTYTHFTTKVDINTLVEITFNRPVYIQKNKVYRVGVVFNTVGWYPMGLCSQKIACESVFFSFGVGNSADSERDGLIRSIVFTCH